MPDRRKGGRVNEREEIARMARRRYQKGCLFRRGKSWVLRYREDVRNPSGSLERIHRCVVLGLFEHKKDARRAADSYLLQFNNGTRRPQTTITFEDFWKEYFDKEVIPTRKLATQESYRNLARVHLLPFFGRQRLSDITRYDVQTFIGQKQRQNYAPKTLAHLRNLLSKVFAVAMKWEWLNSNPARAIELPPMERRRGTRVLTPEEISQLNANLGEPARTIFILGLLTGLRIGEILGLKTTDVDVGTGLVNVRRTIHRGHVQESPKTARSERRVPLAAVLLTAIGEWMVIRPTETEWLFPSKARTPYHDRNLMRREVKPVCKRLSIAPFGWHALRHTFSTFNGNKGVPMPVLQSLLGHAHAETTMIYTHPMEGVQREAVEQLEKVLFPNVPNLLAELKSASKLIQ
jgi:integrase